MASDVDGRIGPMGTPAARHATSRGPAMMATAVAILCVATMASPAIAQGPTVTLEPTGPHPTGMQTITVTGQGFDTAGNGLYLVFGPVTPAPDYYLDPRIYATFKWVHLAAQDSGAEAPLAADGSFTTSIQVPSSFEGPAGAIDCLVVPCAIITFGAHGSQDRSQDTCNPVTFVEAAASASSGPLGSANPEPSFEPTPDASPGIPVPGATATAESPCGVILAAS